MKSSEHLELKDCGHHLSQTKLLSEKWDLLRKVTCLCGLGQLAGPQAEASQCMKLLSLHGVGFQLYSLKKKKGIFFFL